MESYKRNQSTAIKTAFVKLVGQELADKHWYGKPRGVFLRMIDLKPRPTAKAIAEAMANELK